MLPLDSTMFLAVIAANVVAILVAATAINGRRHDGRFAFGQLWLKRTRQLIEEAVHAALV